MSSRFAERLNRSRCAKLGALLALLVACGNKERPRAPEPDAAVSDAAPLDGSVGSLDAGTASPLAWPDAIRAGRFDEASAALATLPPQELDKPEVRLARARVASALGKHSEVITLLEKVHDELPLLRDLVARMRAEAMVEVGPFDKAAEWLATRRDPSSLINAAEAWEKAGDASKARATWDRAVQSAAEKKSRALEEKARYRRLSIVRLKEGDPAAGADARWLTINALDDKVFSEAAQILEALKPPRLLTSEELMARSRVLADAGRADDALRAIDRATTRGTIPAIDVCRAKAEALWKARTRYPEAALAYRACAAMGGAHSSEDLFLSARAFLRAERDTDATVAFQAVIQKHPKTTWADQAEFHVARIHALAGRWKDAAFAFDEYAKHFPNGKEKREADRYCALAHLISRDDKKARKLLEELSGGAEDGVTAARWTNLAALAALRDGDKLHAMSRWADVVRTRPLSYPALVAAARIRENGGAPPSSIEPPESGSADPLPAIDLPPPTDMLHRIGLDAEAESMLREREAAVVAKAPTRGTEALCAAYGLLDGAKRRYQISRNIPERALLTAPGARNGASWDCVFPRPYELLVRGAATRTRIPPELLWAVMRQESAFDPEIVSPARAVGLMQLLPETARATATAASLPYDDSKLTSPADNITLGALYLRELLDKLNDDTTLAVAAYNAGPEATQRWLARATKTNGETLDVFVEAIPYIETRGYVARVLGNLARYGYRTEGEGAVPKLPLELKTERRRVP